MKQSPKEKHLAEALALHAEGSPAKVIAESIGVPVGTVRRWLREDAEKGGSRADDLRRKLEDRLARLVKQSEAHLRAAAPDGADAGKGKDDEAGKTKGDEAKLEDRMLKLCKVLEFLREGEDDIMPQIEAMKRFASFCVRTLTEDEMPPVRKAVRLFLDNLKREHS